jgi:hypothetical protein
LWTSVITGRYPPPVFEATKHYLDPVTPLIPALVVADGRFPFLPAWYARAYLLVLQRFSEPIGMVSAISEKPLHLGQPADERTRPDVVADGAGSQEQVNRTALAVADGVQLRIYAALGSADQAPAPPFLTPKLDAVRWAFK